MLKAGILEIADCFVVNKADVEGADRTVQQLREMLEYGQDAGPTPSGHHGPEALADGDGTTEPTDDWRPPIVETVATSGDGIEELLDVFTDHRRYLEESGQLATVERTRYAEEIRTLLREDLGAMLETELDRRGGLDDRVERVRQRETDPYTVAGDLLEPVRDCIENRTE
jgi:LAO/AO transport system kinase